MPGPPSDQPGDLPLLDVRPDEAFSAGHAREAAGIPLEELAGRTHELPAADVALRVVDADPARASRAAAFLHTRGHPVDTIPWDPAAATTVGPAAVRLWRPNPFLVESLERIDADERAGPAGAFAPARRALDVACGTGRDAVYLALRGYAVDAVDVLPDALDRATDLARRSGVTIAAAARDVERDPALPRAAYALVAVFRFLHRGLFPALRAAVAPGGYVAYETFHERNRATGRRPNGPAHLLASGELAAAFAGFDVRIARDAVERDGRFYSALLARRPAAADAPADLRD